MGRWDDRYRRRLSIGGEADSKFRQVEQWVNDLPIPRAYTSTYPGDAVAITFAHAVVPGYELPFYTQLPNVQVMVFTSVTLVDGGAGWGQVRVLPVVAGATFTETVALTGVGGLGLATVEIPKPGLHTLTLSVRKTINAGTVSVRGADFSGATVLVLA